MRLRMAKTVLAWLMVGVLLWPSQTLRSCCCAARAAVIAPEVTPAEFTAPASTTRLRPCCQKRAAQLAVATNRKQAPAPRCVTLGSAWVQRLSSHNTQQHAPQWQARCCCDEARSALAPGISPERVRLVLQTPQELVTCSLFTASRDVTRQELENEFHPVPDPHPAPPDLSRLCRWLV